MTGGTSSPVRIRGAPLAGLGAGDNVAVLATYVQPYKREASSTCPWGELGDGGPAQLAVFVEGTTTAQTVHEVEACEGASALPARIA